MRPWSLIHAATNKVWEKEKDLRQPSTVAPPKVWFISSIYDTRIHGESSKPSQVKPSNRAVLCYIFFLFRSVDKRETISIHCCHSDFSLPRNTHQLDCSLIFIHWPSSLLLGFLMVLLLSFTCCPSGVSFYPCLSLAFSRFICKHISQ